LCTDGTLSEAEEHYPLDLFVRGPFSNVKRGLNVYLILRSINELLYFFLDNQQPHLAFDNDDPFDEMLLYREHSMPRRRSSIVGNNNTRGSYGKILIALLLGIVLGRFRRPSTHSEAIRCPDASGGGGSAASAAVPETMTSSIQHLRDIPIRSTAHVDPNTGTAITKQQFLEPFQVPTVAGFSVATIRKNQTVEMHSHRSMHEFFYVLEGTATFSMMDETTGETTGYNVEPGTFVHFVPHCVHGIVVPGNSTEGDLKVLLAGVTVGE
jgi:quercetin dioxygenase-like cupin family protein